MSEYKPDQKLVALLQRVAGHCAKVNPPLSLEQIDQVQQALKPMMGEGIRFPDALRQLYAFCNGLSVHDADLWTFGFNVLPLTTSSTGLDFFGDQELRADWLKEMCEKKGVRPEESVAHRSWLPVAATSEFDFYFVNVDPAFPRVYGSVRRMVANCFADEHPACASIAELLVQAAAYIDRRERARKRLAAEHPDQAADQIEVSFRDDDDDEGHD